MTETLGFLVKNEGLSKTASTCDLSIRPEKFPFILEIPPFIPVLAFILFLTSKL